MKLVALLLLLSACGGAPSATGTPPGGSTAEVSRGSTSEMSVQELHAARESVAVLIDVRTPGEFASGHVPGAIHIPMDEIDARLAELEPYRDGEIHLICQSGRRSGIVARSLAAKGFNAVNVTGGTGGWIAAGFPVE